MAKQKEHNNNTTSSVLREFHASTTTHSDRPAKKESININNITKSYYHTFKYSPNGSQEEEREITLCVLSFLLCKHSITYRIGYSVKLPYDAPDINLAKNISKGRAMIKKACLNSYTIMLHDLNEDSSKGFAKDRNMLKAIARYWERKLCQDMNKYIKGIKTTS